MIGFFNIVPKSQAALQIVNIHGGVMGVDKQQRNEVLLWCATPTCPCWSTRRWRGWFKLNTDVVLGTSVAMADITLAEVNKEINDATSVVGN